MVLHDIEFSSICISNVVMRVTINSGYYDIFVTTELVSVGSDPRCVENLGDAFLQAGVIRPSRVGSTYMIPSAHISSFSVSNKLLRIFYFRDI